MRLLSVCPGAGFSRKRATRPDDVQLDHAERRWVGHRCQVECGGRAQLAVAAHQRAEVEVVDDIAVHDHERVVDAGIFTGEADRPRRVERLWLDGVAQPHRTAAVAGERGDERIGHEPQRQRDCGDPVALEPAHEPGDDRLVAHGEHRLGDRVRQRAQAGSEPADQHDRVHQPAVVEGTSVLSVGVVPATPVDVRRPARCEVGRGRVTGRRSRRSGSDDSVMPRPVGAGVVDRTETGQVGRPRRHHHVDVVGHERDGVHEAVAVERDVGEPGGIRLLGVGIGVVGPHDDLQRGVLAVALLLALFVREREIRRSRAWPTRASRTVWTAGRWADPWAAPACRR